MPRHWTTALVLLAVAGADAADACSIPTSTPAMERQYAQSSNVFVGRVVSVEAGVVDPDASPPHRVAVEGTFRVLEVLKGEPPADGKIRAPAVEACGPFLLVGWEYVFFLQDGNFIGSWEGALPWYKWPNNRERLLQKLGIGAKVRE